jgi:hypothetical protein
VADGWRVQGCYSYATPLYKISGLVRRHQTISDKAGDLVNGILIFMAWTVIPTKGLLWRVFAVVNGNHGDKVVTVGL